MTAFLNTAVLVGMAVLAGSTSTALVIFILTVFVLLCVVTLLKVRLQPVPGGCMCLVTLLVLLYTVTATHDTILIEHGNLQLAVLYYMVINPCDASTCRWGLIQVQPMMTANRMRPFPLMLCM